MKQMILGAVAGTCLIVLVSRDADVTAPLPPATYVGAQACGSCHARERDAWNGTQHQRAMQEANEHTLLGDFDGAHFTYGGVTSTFFRRAGRFWVNTDGPDGKLADFRVKYTYGVAPLQQVLLELPGGRLQALGIAWDTRSKERGGQRWFHLYPDQSLKAGDPQHWTGIDQSWNYQCADCHSTHVEKHYDASKRSYATTWSELDVACEACHGPGSNHVSWAKRESGWQRFAHANRGLSESLRAGAELHSGRGERELFTCARCHSRRGQQSDDVLAGRPFADGYRLALLTDGLYHVDGQQKEEVYDVGSFLQSKMHARGVTCSDCHDPHSLTLRAEGNALCTRCHVSKTYDGPQHTFHQALTLASLCVTCHMPTTTYMIIDPRHDHSLRVPRPDRTVTLGTPNVCNGCHADKSALWAAQKIVERYGHAPSGNQRFAEAFANGGAAGLLEVAVDVTEPAIVRASALARLGPGGAFSSRVVRPLLHEADPLIRTAAIEALAAAEPNLRVDWFAALLKDPVRGVREAAARALAGAPEERLAPDDRVAFSRALDEYVAAQRFNADRPESQSNLAMLAAVRGDTAGAEAALKEAIALDATFAPAWLTLADLNRRLGREAVVERVLREGLTHVPDEPALHHALGLALVRQKKSAEALAELGRAAALAPDNVVFAYAHALALHDAGRVDDAIAELQRARVHGSREVLQALVSFESERGDVVAARAFAAELVDATPEDPGARELLQSLGDDGSR